MPTSHNEVTQEWKDAQPKDIMPCIVRVRHCKIEMEERLGTGAAV